MSQFTELDENDCFYSVAKKIRTERLKEEENEKTKLTNIAEQTFSIFRTWCLAYYPIIINDKIDIERTKNEVFTNLELFKKYCIEYEIGFWIKKEILHKYYSLDFKFDYEKNKWLQVN